jgi:hypothetical protein
MESYKIMDFEDWWNKNSSMWASLGSSGKLLAHEAWLASELSSKLRVDETFKHVSTRSDSDSQIW